MYVTIVLMLIVLSTLYVIKKRNVLKELPETPARFISGHYHQIRTTTNILNAFSNFTKNASIARVRLGPTFVGILTTDYKFVEFLLTSNKILKKSQNYEFLKPWLGSGLILADGEKWRKHRKMLTPAFHFDILKQFVTVFESAGNVFVDKLAKYDGSCDLDVYPLVTLHTLDIICETAMGTKINAQNGENVEYVNSVKEMCNIITKRCLEVLQMIGFTFVLTPTFWRQKKLLKSLHNFTMKVIEAKKKNTGHLKDGINRKKSALLDLMIRDHGNVLTSEEIREEVDTFMFAGHDTTASGICFVLYCLANHPEVQKKAFEEQQELFSDEKHPIVTYQHLQNMKYLELVIKETLRLYPPVSVIGRRTSEDVQFENVHIPKNTNIAMFIYGINRNPLYFPEPETFYPERFAPPSKLPPYAYVPFSAGPRNCIGQKFAMLEMKSTVSKVIRNFELRPAFPKHEMVLAAETVLKSVNGVKIGLRKRV